MRRKTILVLCAAAVRLWAQDGTDTQTLMKQLLQRMDALEQENRQLRDEVHALRQDIESAQDTNTAKASPPQTSPSTPNQDASLTDRVAVNERRVAEQAQTKVEASQKFPIHLNGALLFNAFTNSNSQEIEYGHWYPLLTGPSLSGATVRQTLLGLDFQGPTLPGSGRVTGSLTMDFFSGPSTPGDNWLRIRRADISLAWPDRTISVGQDKSLISPYQPDSLAEVGVPPLAGSGNLWLWLPQARYEERFHLDENTGLIGQVAVIQTGENYQTVSSTYATSLQPARPGLEGRGAFWHKFDETRRIDIGAGFHVSATHVAGSSVPSRIASLDWHVTPFWKFDFTGTMYTGQNVAGLGALGNGFTVLSNGTVQPVHSKGIWGQISAPLTQRLTLNVFAGLEDDRAIYPSRDSIGRNLTYASNLMYHIGPNVVVAFEGLQMRSRYFYGAKQIDNHYDLALGYFF
jgi:hypothetical protein